MSMSFEDIVEDLHDKIDGVNRYNPENVTELEKCIKTMINDSEYDRDICLTTLKLYQLNPDKYDEVVVRNILMKTLMNLPAPDFALAKYLIDASRLGSQELKRIFDLGTVLESCNFAVFWKLMKGEYKPSSASDEKFRTPAEIPKLVRSVNGFEEAVRQFGCRVISVTYQNIAKDVLVRLLGGASDSQLAEYAKKFGWEYKSGDKSYFIANHEATIKSRNIDEKLTFDDVQDILREVSTTHLQ